MRSPGMFAIAFVAAAVSAGVLLVKSRSAVESPRPHPLDYDHAVIFDAEDLAEGGIRAAYDRLVPLLRKHTSNPWLVDEHLDPDTGAYAVTAGGNRYLVCGPSIDEGESWGRATFALFSIVNRQIADSKYRLYAINGGHDLFGLFLGSDEAEAAQRSLSERRDWPYLPTEDPPWFGQFH